MIISLITIKENIIEELNDAVKYMENAVEHKGTLFGEYFCSMSKNELEHANILLKMFNKSEKSDKISDSDHVKMYKEIMEEYSNAMTKIESLKKIFWSV